MTDLAQLNTKSKILVAAGELFAERGLSGTSVREIVERSGVALSAVNYHFGSKDALYLAAVDHVLAHPVSAAELFTPLDGADGEDPAADVALLHQCIRDHVFRTLAADTPAWRGRLLARAFMEVPADDLGRLHANLSLPFDHLERFFRLYRPRLSRDLCALLVSRVFLVAHSFAFAKDLHLLILKKEDYDEAFLELLAWDATRGIALALGLDEPPMPASAEEASTKKRR